MSGKALFDFFYPMIKLAIGFFKLLPCSIRRGLFDFFALIPTKLGAGIRYIILASMCNSIGKNVYIGRYVTIKEAQNLRVGNNVSIHDNCYIDASGGITIGSDVSIAHACSVLSFEHQYNDITMPIKYNGLFFKEVVIHNDIWIGCGVRILSGTQIHNRVIVAAGAVVKGKLSSNSIYGGIPCRLIKEI